MKSKFNFIIVVAIFLFIALIVRYSLSMGDKTISNDAPLNNLQENKKVLNIDYTNENFIPDTDYSCEEIIPDNIRLLGKSGVFFVLWDKINEHSLMTVGAYCKQNQEVGQIASQFKCRGLYSIMDRVSEKGIIEKDYKVIFDLTFDENNCEQIVVDGMNYVDCEVIDSSCLWEYCNGRMDCNSHKEL